MASTDFYGFLHCIGNYASYTIPLGILLLSSGIANVYLSAKLAFRGHGLPLNENVTIELPQLHLLEEKDEET